MTIQEMLEREDIYSIIETTLVKYYREVHHTSAKVKIQSKFNNKYVVYPRLGVIISRTPSLSVIKDTYCDFDVQNNPVRKLIAWGYITACLCTFGLLASKSLFVSDKKLLHNGVRIMPCNRKIRLFDYRQGVVDAMLKDGFNDLYFKTELSFRKNPIHPFIPKIVKSGNRWYRELILDGKGLVRIPEPKYSEKLQQTLSDLMMLQASTRKEADALAYCQDMQKYIIESLPVLKVTKHIQTTDYIKDVTNKCYRYVEQHNQTIPMALSHGDLQTGNIFVESAGNVILIDWETATLRSVWYDMGRLILYSQRKGKYAAMVNGRNSVTVKDALLVSDGDKERDMNLVCTILIIEEIKAFVDEIIDLPGSIGTEIMDRLIDEFYQIPELNGK